MVFHSVRLGLLSCIVWLCCTNVLAQDNGVVANKEITDLYSKSDQQIEGYLKALDEMDLRFKQELLGKGYVTKVFSTKVETIYKTFQKNRDYVVEAQQKHRANAKQMGKVDRWIDKMRDWADYNTRTAIKYTWLAKMDLVKAEVARVFTLARDFSQLQAKTLKDEKDKFQEQFGYDYKKIDKNMAIVYRNVAENEVKEVQKIWQQYQEVGKEFVRYRKQLAEDTWRWYHYLFDQHFEDRAKSFKKLVYKSFAYDLGERPKPFLMALYGSTSFADSDMDFFMNMAGTEDRLSMYIHAAKNIDVFYKLNGFVANRPVELYDRSDFLVPLTFSGSIIERIAKILASRQKSYYLTSQEIQRVVTQLAPSISKAEVLLGLITQASNNSQDIERFINGTELLEDLAKDIDDAKENLSGVEKQLSSTHSLLVRQRIDFETRKKYQKIRVILDYRTNKYRLAKKSESGKNKNDVLKSFNTRIKLLDDQMKKMEDQPLDVQQRISQRRESLKQDKEQLLAISSLEDDVTKKAIKDLVEKERLLESTLDIAKTKLSTLEKKRVDGSAEGVNRTYFSVQQQYAELYSAIIDGKSDPFLSIAAIAKQELLKPETEKLENDVAAQIEILSGYRRGLMRIQPTLRERSNVEQQKVNRQLANLKRLDKKQALYARAVVRHKAQAASVVIFVAQQAGANATDPIVQFMESLREAAKVTQKYLTPSEVAYETLNVNAEEKQLLSTGNSVVQYFASDAIDALKLDKLKEKIAVAKRAAALVENYAVKGKVIGSALGALRSNEDANLSNSLSYFATIAEIGKMASDGVPVFGDLFGSYMDFMSYAVNSIRTQALSIQDRVFSNAEKYLVVVKPEQHLYTKAEIESEMSTINFSDRERVLRIYQIRRVVALMQAQSYKDVCNRPLGNSNRCN